MPSRQGWLATCVLSLQLLNSVSSSDFLGVIGKCRFAQTAMRDAPIGQHFTRLMLEEEDEKVKLERPLPTLHDRFCTLQLACDKNARYRTFDGTCSNLKRPLEGSKYQCHRRLLPASFTDGISAPPKRVDVATIFNALQARKPPSGTRQTTALFVGVMQFLAHDLTQTFLFEVKDCPDCCDPRYSHLPQCSMNINVTLAVGYKDFNVTCMPFVRSARCPCSQDRASDSMNFQTAHIDLSHIYLLDGSARDSNKKWLLASMHSNVSGELFPIDKKPRVCYDKDQRCFLGDGRLDQQQLLSLNHVVFLRLHNRIAERLRRLNPNWMPDKIFQEARKIVIARWQYVVSNELMSILIGNKTLIEHKLHIDQLIKGTSVDSSAEAVTFAESVHSEMRQHGLLPDQVGKNDYFWIDSSRYYTEKDFIPRLSVDHWTTPSNRMFPFTTSIAQEILKSPRDQLGISMPMLNIQRGRDVGLPSYQDIISWAINKTVNSYEKLANLNIFRKDDLNLLKSVYPNFADIDMFVGGFLEKTNLDGEASVSHRKIRVTQHYGHVYGDRFFFSHKDIFSQQQRNAIAESSQYAQILCETLDLHEVPENIFLHATTPKMRKCSSFRKFNIQNWKNI